MMSPQEKKAAASSCAEENTRSFREEKAVSLFREGANCSQAVFAAFSDVTGLSESMSLRLASGFGGGFGRLREVCGAVSGMTMVLSTVFGYDKTDDPDAKAVLYARIQTWVNAFKAENGSYICRELLQLQNDTPVSAVPTPRTEDFYRVRPCAGLVASAVRLTEQALSEKTE